jgi:thiamine-phosphate pyrophosphorylase
VTGAPHLYIITDRTATAGRPLPSVIAAALAGAAPAIRAGARVAVQIREKDLPARSLLALARELRAITSAAGAALFINDRVDVALAVGADGVHLGGRSLAPADVAAIGPSLPVAVSLHHLEEVAAAARHPNVRFAVFSPVYWTPEKTAPVGLAGSGGLAAAVTVANQSSAPLPILALGGVGPEQVPECLAVGAAGVACIRAVLSHTDPGRVVAEILFSREKLMRSPIHT